MRHQCGVCEVPIFVRDTRRHGSGDRLRTRGMETFAVVYKRSQRGHVRRSTEHEFVYGRPQARFLLAGA